MLFRIALLTTAIAIAIVAVPAKPMDTLEFLSGKVEGPMLTQVSP